MSQKVLELYAEAASVILWQFDSGDSETRITPGRWTHKDNNSKIVERQVEIRWDAPSKNILQTHGNEKDATTDAAYAVAVAVAAALGYCVIRRVFHGSGSDLLMVPLGEPENDFYAVEVSGMVRQTTESLKTRLKTKVRQGSRGELRRPGVAIVTLFENLIILSEAWKERKAAKAL